MFLFLRCLRGTNRNVAGELEGHGGDAKERETPQLGCQQFSS